MALLACFSLALDTRGRSVSADQRGCQDIKAQNIPTETLAWVAGSVGRDLIIWDDGLNWSDWVCFVMLGAGFLAGGQGLRVWLRVHQQSSDESRCYSRPAHPHGSLCSPAGSVCLNTHTHRLYSTQLAAMSAFLAVTNPWPLFKRVSRPIRSVTQQTITQVLQPLAVHPRQGAGGVARRRERVSGFNKVMEYR